nr:G-type lectin S-receptor-like serine/threonine-protein kinase SD2-5 [Ipomoea trifida]
MNIYILVFLVQWLACGCCTSDVHVGYQVTVAVPIEYSRGFVGRAFLMETDQKVLNFKAAISVEAVDEKYTCSLDVFLGDVKVWSSGHLSQFYTTENCILELTQNGDLRLKGQRGSVGWRTGTFGQGVKRLNLLQTGNLVLVDSQNMIKWQSFNFPTNIMLWGQRLSSKTRLTAFPSNSSLFYSLEIHDDKLALYLNSGKWKYSYWEFRPSNNRTITYVELTSEGLEIYNGIQWRIAQLRSKIQEPPKFLALGNNSGNLGLYYYSADKGVFEVSYKAINSTCDLPLVCKPYGICTFSSDCSCIRLIKRGDGLLSDCSEEITGGICNTSRVEMLELRGVKSVLSSNSKKVNVKKEACANLCLDNCTCVAALYSPIGDDANLGECYLYGLVRGVKQIERESKWSYMVKVPKEVDEGHGKHSGLKKWVSVVVGVVDGFVILIVLGGIGYYVVQKRKMSTQSTEDTN